MTGPSRALASVRCFFLHSEEHTGCFVSLQYRLAVFLQTIHQPNLPASIPSSFYRFTSGQSFLLYGIGFKGIRNISSSSEIFFKFLSTYLPSMSSAASCWGSYSSWAASTSTCLSTTAFTRASCKHTLSTIFWTMLKTY